MRNLSDHVGLALRVSQRDIPGHGREGWCSGTAVAVPEVIAAQQIATRAYASTPGERAFDHRDTRRDAGQGGGKIAGTTIADVLQVEPPARGPLLRDRVVGIECAHIAHRLHIGDRYRCRAGALYPTVAEAVSDFQADGLGADESAEVDYGFHPVSISK